MKFLEAKRILSEFQDGVALSFLLGMSAESKNLEVFVRAAAAARGYSAHIRALPFNTLAQHIRAPSQGEREVFLLFPWDLAPEADWRSGFPKTQLQLTELRDHARRAGSRFSERPNSSLLFVAAQTPPILASSHEAAALGDVLVGVVRSLGGEVVPSTAFSLESYLNHGDPLASAALADVAGRIVDRALDDQRQGGCKVLVSDFDNVLWQGIVGEDGVDGVSFGPQGLGYRHFLYQTFLRNLKGIGVLLAGVTRNDRELALGPLSKPESVLEPDDFVSIAASYHAKSAQIEMLAEHLNLGLGEFVFVDDNPVELAEVAAALPSVRGVPFPTDSKGMIEFFYVLSRLFHREGVTGEDRERTEMYRRQLQSLVPRESEGADLQSFLQDLEMSLTIHDRTSGDRTRALQLINKTNQFNLNGERVSDQEVREVLESGGRLYTASMADRNGEHGEIVACLIDPDGVVQSFVMSCRVFQRRVEFAFLLWLGRTHPSPLEFMFRSTDRNEPLRTFLEDVAFSDSGPRVGFDVRRFEASHSSVLELFRIIESEPGGSEKGSQVPEG